MENLREKLTEWRGVIVFGVVAVLLSFTLVIRAADQQAVEERQRQIIAALAAENNEAIAANGDFQTCVWLAIVRPRVIGHQQRAANAIHQCEKKFLS